MTPPGPTRSSERLRAAIPWLLGPATAVVLFALTITSKELSFGLVTRSSLVDISQPSLSGFVLAFQGEPLDRADSLTVRFANSGDTPIEPGDFEDRMTIDLTPSSRVLSATLEQSNPDGVKPTLSVDGHQLFIEPLLLNPGDTFSVTLVVAGDSGDPTLNARISGVSRVRTLASERDLQVSVGLLLAGAGVLALLGYFYLGGLTAVSRSSGEPFIIGTPNYDGAPLEIAFAISAGVALLLSLFWILALSRWNAVIALAAITCCCFPGNLLAMRRARRLLLSRRAPITGAMTPGPT